MKKKFFPLQLWKWAMLRAYRRTSFSNQQSVNSHDRKEQRKFNEIRFQTAATCYPQQSEGIASGTALSRCWYRNWWNLLGTTPNLPPHSLLQVDAGIPAVSFILKVVCVALTTAIPELCTGIGLRVVVPPDPVLPTRTGFKRLAAPPTWRMKKMTTVLVDHHHHNVAG